MVMYQIYQQVNNKISKITVLVSLLLICVSFVFTYHTLAQVNEVSKSWPGDTDYYQLVDVVILQDQVQQSVSVSNNSSINNTTVNPNILQTNQILMIQDIPTTTVASIIVGSTLLPTILTLLSILLTPNGLLLILGSLSRNKDKIFGVIYDVRTKKPIPFVRVKLYYQDSNKFIQEKLSDLKGRYGFPLYTGKYRIEINHPPYKKYVKNIQINESNSFFAEDIGLYEDYLSEIVQQFSIKRLISRLILKLRSKFSTLVVVGLILSILAFLIRGSILEIGLVCLYGTILLINLYINRKQNNQKHWGVVIDSETMLGISGAIVRLYSQNKSLVDTQITDFSGRFGFLVQPGEYLLYVYMQGYIFPSKHQNDVEIYNNNMIKIRIVKSAWVRLNVLLDPIDKIHNNNLEYNGNNTLGQYKFGTI
ncbi:MAG: hypothetical protein NZZ41_05975 [Candidatus Dojkabacteria bacterium]|nr:hypothetical protein [Candidatus Dojkabacteria bacterium]